MSGTPVHPLSLPDYLKTKKLIIDQALEVYLPLKKSGSTLNEAMRYSIFAGGKRIRPIMTIAATEMCDADQRLAMPIGCAIEMIHTYSLIHDDLPAMDNDDLRRGRPTNHKVYGEAIAILAGDTLMTYAYELIVREYRALGLPAAQVLRLIEELSQASGLEGMAGGQAMDLEAETQAIGFSALKKIHELKTGALIRAAFRAGAVVAGADETTLQYMTEYAQHLGVVFQIIDDILDVTVSTDVLGKPANSDIKNHKTTYVSLHGLDQARLLAQQEANQALGALQKLGMSQGLLVDLVDFFLNRTA